MGNTKNISKGIGSAWLVCLLLNSFCCCATISTTPTRDSVAHIYQSYVGVREATGKNDGKQVEFFQSATGNKKGDAWCASFIAAVLKICKLFINGNGAAASWFKNKDVVWKRSVNGLHTFNKLAAKRANTGALWFPKLGRIGHIFFIHNMRGEWVITNEGNTNNGLSREGDGVYMLRRRIRNIYAVSDHIRK